MINKIKNYRNAAKIILMEISIPNLTRKMLSEMDKAKGDDFYILGRAVGTLEKTVQKKINTIHTARDLSLLSRDFNPDQMERFVRCAYAKERCDRLFTDVSALKKSLARKQPATAGKRPGKDPEQLCLEELARQYQLTDEHLARCM